MSVEQAQNKFVELLRGIPNEKEKYEFLDWVRINWSLGDKQLGEEESEADKMLKAIAEEIRLKVPLDGVLPSEKILFPALGPNSDCERKTTVEVDEFLYDDDYVEELVDKGQLSKYFCGDCNSQNIKSLTFISHSMSINGIKYLFKCLLGPLDRQIILDVGSRFGGVLFGAYLYTKSQTIVGVEMNADLCNIQKTIVSKFNFDHRITVICNDILNESNWLCSADVIILNNVFEFFMNEEKSKSAWRFLAQNIKVGCILVTVPHLNETFDHIKVDFNWKEWVEELEPFECNKGLFSEDVFLGLEQNMKHYRVKAQIQGRDAK